MATPPTKLAYFDHMRRLHSTTALLLHLQADDGLDALLLDATIFRPQGCGQPSDTGTISGTGSGFKFLVDEVRSRDDVVGVVLTCRLHSAGHLLDVCMHNVGLNHSEPGKKYQFPDGPFVEYKGLIPQSELQTKRRELEQEIKALISIGGKVTAAVLPYEEASKLCEGSLRDYIPKGSMPRIVTLGNYPGCPCGGTHVADIAEIKSVKVTQIRMKEATKVSNSVDN